MRDYATLRRDIDNRFYVDNNGVKEECSPMFPLEIWDSEEMYKKSNIRGYEPMTAKELETEEEQDKCLNDSSYFVEEKFDGTRAIVQFFSQKTIDDEEVGYARVFSRRISKKTGFYVENSDSVPQIRDINRPEMKDTVLDGEMFINGRPFKDVSSTLNCLWDKAIDRQLELGFISLHAFDIIKYKGIDLRKMKLERRKVFLHRAIEEIGSPYIEEVPYFICGDKIDLTVNDVANRINDSQKTKEFFYDLDYKFKDTYTHLRECWSNSDHHLTPRAYYEMILATGGEGVIVKPRNGLYHHKRGWEYSKIKKFLTREMILMGFDEPTREYSGKAPENWAYYEDEVPVTKHYYNKQVGNMLLGVLITKEDYEKIKVDKRGEIVKPSEVCLDRVFDATFYVMQVCECAGFDDEARAYFTKRKKSLIGSVQEIKANEIMKDSGRLRHPRWLRSRVDKAPQQCTWKDHIGG